MVGVAVNFNVPLCICFIQQGTKAPQAGGKIHTDFEKGFIMAEVRILYRALVSGLTFMVDQILPLFI